MPKKDNKQLFSLVLVLPNNHYYTVEIPKSKKGYQNKYVGGLSTYHMAIDDFTIRFIDKDDLLNYLRDNSLAPISSINNNSIGIMIKCDGKAPISSDYDIAYKGCGLDNFIKETAIGDSFYYEANSFGTRAYDVVNDFKNRVLPLYYNSKLSDYFSKYIDNLNNHSKHKLSSCLKLGYKQEEYAKSKRIFLLNDSAFYEYENIRWFLMTDFMKLEMELAKKRYNDSPYTADERKEALEDYEDTLLEIENRYTNEPYKENISYHL